MYIGNRKIKDIRDDRLNDMDLVIVTYDDDKKETFSKLMYDKLISENPCDLTTLRDLRTDPVVKEMLTVLRNWGVKLNELGYVSMRLNASLQENEKAALKKLWEPIIPTIAEVDDVTMIAVDQVLRNG